MTYIMGTLAGVFGVLGLLAYRYTVTRQEAWAYWFLGSICAVVAWAAP